jgi:antitoxin YefM
VLLAADDYESMRETIAVLSESDLMDSIKRGLAELGAGEYLDEKGLAEYLAHAGRGS